MELEAVVPRGRLALGAGERHLFAGLRMQKDREVAPDRPVAQGKQFLGARADDDPIAIVHRHAEQAVAHRAADDIGLHRRRRITGDRPPVLRAARR